MVINLKKYFSSDAEDTISCVCDFKDTEVGGQHPFDRPVEVQATLKGLSGAVYLNLKLSGEISVPCDRCLETVRIPLHQTISHILVRQLEDDADSDMYICVPEERLDINELVYSDLMLDFPSKVLCSPDCKGLCPMCGVNLNKEKCNCDSHQVDPRLEILKTLIE